MNTAIPNPQNPTRVRPVMPAPRNPVHAASRATPPQAYVPYASPVPSRPYGDRPQYAPADASMMTTAIIGLVLTTLVGIPVGIWTGPTTLKRAKRVEHLMRTGRRPRSDESTITGTRVAAWLSIAWSIPLIAMWLLIAFLMLAVLA